MNVYCNNIESLTTAMHIKATQKRAACQTIAELALYHVCLPFYSDDQRKPSTKNHTSVQLHNGIENYLS